VGGRWFGTLIEGLYQNDPSASGATAFWIVGKRGNRSRRGFYSSALGRFRGLVGPREATKCLVVVSPYIHESGGSGMRANRTAVSFLVSGGWTVFSMGLEPLEFSQKKSGRAESRNRRPNRAERTMTVGGASARRFVSPRVRSPTRASASSDWKDAVALSALRSRVTPESASWTRSTM